MELVHLVHCDSDPADRWRLDPNCMPEMLQTWTRVKYQYSVTFLKEQIDVCILEIIPTERSEPF